MYNPIYHQYSQSNFYPRNNNEYSNIYEPQENHYQNNNYKNNTKTNNTFNNTARLVNSVNSIAFKNFNKWGGMSFEDILNTYPKELQERIWFLISRNIIENYQMGKGTLIKGFGLFTFYPVEYSLEGVNNQYNRDIKKRRPVFIVSKEFVEYLRPGIYNESNGLIPYNQKLNNNVNTVRINYASLSYSANISKEEFFNISSNLFKKMSDEIRRGLYKPKKMPYLGTLILRNNIFGMKFENEIYNKNILKTQKLIHMKKNMNLFMETKDSQKQRVRNIEDIDRAEREIRPQTAVLTKIDKSGENWLKNKMDIDLNRDVTEEPRDDEYIPTPKNLKDYEVDQRYYREYPKQLIGYLNIPQDILEAILNQKWMLLLFILFLFLILILFGINLI